MTKLNAKVLAMERTLLDATSTAVYHTGTVIPLGCRRLDEKTAPFNVPSELPLVIGLFKKGAKGRYAMIVNRNYRRPVTIPVTLRPQTQKASLISARGSAFRRATEGGTIELTLPAGGAALLRLHMRED